MRKALAALGSIIVVEACIFMQYGFDALLLVGTAAYAVLMWLLIMHVFRHM